jgi:hypothetical protein
MNIALEGIWNRLNNIESNLEFFVINLVKENRSFILL